MRKVSVKKNVVLNVCRQACNILFPLVTYPYISRILGNSAYGMYSFADSVVSYFVLIAGLGITTYSVREGSRIRDNKSLINGLVSELFSINIIFTFVAYFILIILSIFNARLNQDATLIMIRSLVIVLMTIGVDWVNNIFEDFYYITIRYIVIQIISIILMICFVHSPKDVVIYTAIMVFSSAGGNLLNMFYIRRYVKIRFTWRGFAKHMRSLLVFFANNVAITIYVNSDITMLGFYLEDKDVGVYSLASKVYHLIKLMINAIVVVMIPRLSHAIHDKGKYEKYLLVIGRGLVLVTLPLVAVTFSLSSQIIYVVGGNEFIVGKKALSILAFAIISAIGGSFFSNCILIENKGENRILIATAIAAGINVLMNIILIPILGICGAAITTLIAETLACVIEGSGTKKYIDIRKLWHNDILMCIWGSVVIGAICFGVRYIISHNILCIIVSMLISIPVYVFINIKSEIMQLFISESLKTIRR